MRAERVHGERRVPHPGDEDAPAEEAHFVRGGDPPDPDAVEFRGFGFRGPLSLPVTLN